jgi:hypothetical protein
MEETCRLVLYIVMISPVSHVSIPIVSCHINSDTGLYFCRSKYQQGLVYLDISSVHYEAEYQKEYKYRIS